MKAALVSLGSVSSKWIAEAMGNYFSKVDMIDIRNIEINLGEKEPLVLYMGKPIDEYDCIYVKGSFRYNPVLRSITSCLINKTYMPIQAHSFTIGHDKLLTQLQLQQSGIPTPKTYLAATPKAAKEILEKVSYPIIMKFPEGTQGKGVMFSESFPAASSMLDALIALKQPFVIQEYIETAGTDIRVIVVGDKVVASMKRKAAPGEKRANVHQGGEGEAYLPNSYMKKIAVQVAEAVGSEICAVDFLETPKGPVVLELNLSPGLQGITEATNINIADKIAKYLFKATKEFVKGKNFDGAAKILDDVGIRSSAATEKGSIKEIITNLDFRGNRILLPDMITKVTKFNEKDEVLFLPKEGHLIIKKFMNSEEED